MRFLRCHSTLSFLYGLTLIPSALLAQTSRPHTTTHWDLEPSLKYDALCLLNVLSGDPYYLEFYRIEYDHFHPLFTPEEQASFVELKQIIKDQGRGIVSAQLALQYSVVDDETLPQMIQTAHDSSTMRSELRRTPYWSNSSWATYERARPALERALRALDRVGFPAYWEQTSKPKIEAKIQALSPELPKYDIIPVIESFLGFQLPSDTITVYLLAYSEPHGIRITGLRFLTHYSYPFSIVLHNAIHEPMHPPYDANDPTVKKAVAQLSADPMISDKVEHHDPSFGYNSPAGYIEEDSVQALEQIVSERVGFGQNVCRYWEEQDGGMHVLAAAIYWEYKSALDAGPQPYSAWFTKAVADGKLRGEPLKAAVRQVLPAGKCPQAIEH